MILKSGMSVKIPEKWMITAEKGSAVSIFEGDTERIKLTSEGGKVSVFLTITPFDDDSVKLYGDGDGEVKLVYTGNRTALYIGDSLWDEDWPIGEFPSELTVKEASGRLELTEDLTFDREYLLRGDNRTFTDISECRPCGTDGSCGDCMPFTDPKDGTYRLFYLYDRRHHWSKHHTGAHQWGQVSTADGKVWHTEPMAISIDEQWEGSICTGSVIENEGKYYGFYAVRMTNGTPAVITWAVSDDCRHFKKSGKSLTLKEPYEPVSARDPKLFRDERGLFHMLVTTSVGDKGALAHLTSENLEDWTQREPFAVMKDDMQPECPDFFKFKGRYYLLYTQDANARYFVSDSVDGEFKAPTENNIIADETLIVPKGAFLKGELVFAGFVLDEGKKYGGHIELYRADADENGVLSFSRF